MYNLSNNCTLTFKFNNNKVMYHQPMNLSHMFDPNTMYTADKIVVKHISLKETLLKLDLESKGQSHNEKQNNMQGNKNIPPPNKLSRDSLGNCVQLMSRTGCE